MSSSLSWAGLEPAASYYRRRSKRRSRIHLLIVLSITAILFACCGGCFLYLNRNINFGEKAMRERLEELPLPANAVKVTSQTYRPACHGNGGCSDLLPWAITKYEVYERAWELDTTPEQVCGDVLAVMEAHSLQIAVTGIGTEATSGETYYKSDVDHQDGHYPRTFYRVDAKLCSSGKVWSAAIFTSSGKLTDKDGIGRSVRFSGTKNGSLSYELEHSEHSKANVRRELKPQPW